MILARLVFTASALRVALGQSNCPADVHGCLESGVLLQPRSLLQKGDAGIVHDLEGDRENWRKWLKKAKKKVKNVAKKVKKHAKKINQKVEEVAKHVGLEDELKKGKAKLEDKWKTGTEALKKEARSKFAKQIAQADSLFAKGSDFFAQFGEKKQAIKEKLNNVSASAEQLKDGVGELSKELNIDVAVFDSIGQLDTVSEKFDKQYGKVEERFKNKKKEWENLKNKLFGSSLLQSPNGKLLEPILDSAKKILKDNLSEVLFKKLVEIEDRLRLGKDKTEELISAIKDMEGVNAVMDILDKFSSSINDVLEKIDSGKKKLESMLQSI